MKAYSIAALASMTRPMNAFVAGAAVLVGYDLGGGEVGLTRLILGPLSTALITGFANLDNDIADVESDRINHPSRPLPSGRVSMRSVGLFALVMLTLGLLAAGFCGRAALALCGVASMWLAAYNHWGKRTFLLGNLMVALAGGLPLVYAGIIATPEPGKWKLLWVGFLLGCGLHLVREMLKDTQDMEGDARAGASTLPIRLGARAAVRLSAILLVLIAILSVVPGMLRWFNRLYFIGSIAVVALPAALGGIRLWSGQATPEARRWARTTKVLMICGLILLWLGAP